MKMVWVKCVQAIQQQGTVVMHLQTRGGGDIELPMNDYGGFLSWLDCDQSVASLAHLPEEWIAQEQCSELEWNFSAGAHNHFHNAQACMQHNQGQIQQVHPVNITLSQGQGMYGSSTWAPPPNPDQECVTDTHHQSREQ